MARYINCSDILGFSYCSGCGRVSSNLSRLSMCLLLVAVMVYCLLPATSNTVCTLSHCCKAAITIVIHLQYDDTKTHLTATEVIEITICVRFDCDTTTTRLQRKIDVHFLLASNPVEWKQARAVRCTRIVVVS